MRAPPLNILLPILLKLQGLCTQVRTKSYSNTKIILNYLSRAFPRERLMSKVMNKTVLKTGIFVICLGTWLHTPPRFIDPI